jgi:hypothetical protein
MPAAGSAAGTASAAAGAAAKRDLLRPDPRSTLHAVVQLVARLTKNHALAEQVGGWVVEWLRRDGKVGEWRGLMQMSWQEVACCIFCSLCASADSLFIDAHPCLLPCTLGLALLVFLPARL